MARLTVEWFLERVEEDGQKLDLKSNRIGVEGARALAGALEKMPGLQHLDLKDNNIGDEGVRALAGALEKVPGLQQLDLGLNIIGVKGVRALAGALEKVPGLQQLDLKSNRIGVEGARALAGALEKMPGLQHLDLQDNNIGDEGVRALAGALEKVPGLQHLNLQYNNIGNEGARALAGALEKVPGLQQLYFRHNENSERLKRSYYLQMVETDDALVSAAVYPIYSVCVAFLRCLEGLTTNVTVSSSPNILNEEALLHLLGAWEDGISTTLVFSRVFSEQNRARAERLIEARQSEGSAKALLAERWPDEPLKHTRLLLCGEGQVGKSTLREHFVSFWKKSSWLPRSPRGSPRSTWFTGSRGDPPLTVGMEVEHLTIKDLEVALWDLGGQQEFHVLHSILMPDTSRTAGRSSLFVLVLRLFDEVVWEELRRELLYWLRMISSTSLPGIRRCVQVVLNQWEGTAVGLRDGWLVTCCRQEVVKWNDRKGDRCLAFEPVVVNAKKGGAEVKTLYNDLMCKLEEGIRDAKVPSICNRVLERVGRIVVEKRSFPVLHWADFCRDVLALGEEAGYPTTEFVQTVLEDAVMRVVQDTGNVVWVKELDCVVLSPEWVGRQVIGELLGVGLSHERLEITGERPPVRNGQCKRRQLAQWYSKYHGRDGEWFIQLLDAMELCFQPPNASDQVVIPSLLMGSSGIHRNERVLKAWLVDDQEKVLWKAEKKNFRHSDFSAWGIRIGCADPEAVLIGATFFVRLLTRLAQSSTETWWMFGETKLLLKERQVATLVEFDAAHDCWVDILVRPYAGGTRSAANMRTCAEEMVAKVRKLLAESCIGVSSTTTFLGPFDVPDGLKLPMGERREHSLPSLQAQAELATQPYGRLVPKSVFVRGQVEGARVFLSHRGPDSKDDLMVVLRNKLAEKGMRPFLDKRDLLPGCPADQVMMRRLLAAEVVIVVLSPTFCESSYCMNELHLAMGRGPGFVLPVFYKVTIEEFQQLAGQAAKRWGQDAECWGKSVEELCRVAGIMGSGKDLQMLLEEIVAGLEKLLEVQQKQGLGGKGVEDEFW